MNKKSKHKLLLKASYDDAIDELYSDLDWYYNDEHECDCENCTGIYGSSPTYVMNKYSDADIEREKYETIMFYEVMRRKMTQYTFKSGIGRGCGGTQTPDGKGYGHGSLLCGYKNSSFSFYNAAGLFNGITHDGYGYGSGAGNMPGEVTPGCYGSGQSYESSLNKDILPYEIIVERAHL